MPFHWSVERERQMLLLIIQSANLRPSAEHWSAVASQLGGGLTQSAVSQKYYKLRNESSKTGGTRPRSQNSTPTKRKASDDDEVKPTPPKRVKVILKEELSEGDPLVGSSQNPFKSEAKVEAIEIATDDRQQQELWNSFQYHDGFGHAESNHTSRWVEGLVQARDF